MDSIASLARRVGAFWYIVLGLLLILIPFSRLNSSLHVAGGGVAHADAPINNGGYGCSDAGCDGCSCGDGTGGGGDSGGGAGAGGGDAGSV